MFLIPPVASVVLFGLLWCAELLPRPLFVGACVVVGVVGQLLAPAFSTLWVAALLLNVSTGIYLTTRMKLDW
jgi:hypothetical protein